MSATLRLCHTRATRIVHGIGYEIAGDHEKREKRAQQRERFAPEECHYAVAPIAKPLRVSTIDFPHHDIDAAENHHHVGDGVAETHVLQNR